MIVLSLLEIYVQLFFLLDILQLYVTYPGLYQGLIGLIILTFGTRKPQSPLEPETQLTTAGILEIGSPNRLFHQRHK